MNQEAFQFDEESSLDRRFREFNAAHPDVFVKLVEYARIVRRTKRKCSVKLLWERLRWYYVIERDENEEFKLNNNYHSRYARLLMETYPEEFEGFFDTRELRS